MKRMGRWEPNARGRLEQAAWELFKERGYTQTTVEDIAARAGLTERTFFRHFADKREVLFWGAGVLQKAIVDAIADAPLTSAPLDAVAAALEAAAGVLQPRQEYARARQTLIGAHAELQERESIKLRSIATAVADALRSRGVAESAATLTAEAGVTVFKVAFERWIEDRKPRDLAQHIRTTLKELKAVTGVMRAATSKSRIIKASRRKSPRARSISQ
jgi:AcrR family transcriptional regulator